MKKNPSLGFTVVPSWTLPVGTPVQVILRRKPHLPKLGKAENLGTAVQPTLTSRFSQVGERGQQMASAASQGNREQSENELPLCDQQLIAGGL